MKVNVYCYKIPFINKMLVRIKSQLDNSDINRGMYREQLFREIKLCADSQLKQKIKSQLPASQDIPSVRVK